MCFSPFVRMVTVLNLVMTTSLAAVDKDDDMSRHLAYLVT